MSRQLKSKRVFRRITIAVLTLAILGFISLFTLSMTAQRPNNLGVTNGRLSPCPDSPNCVSSTATNAGQFMEPIPFEGSAIEALARVRAILAEVPRCEIITYRDDYLHAEFTSRIFRFIDDVEFLVDPENRQIHFRSASRVGHSDFGANRKRMARLSAAIRS